MVLKFGNGWETNFDLISGKGKLWNMPGFSHVFDFAKIALDTLGGLVQGKGVLALAYTSHDI